MERAYDILVESLDTVLLIVADLGQSFDNGPQFEDIILHLLDVDSTRDGVAAGHFFNISLEFADLFADDLRVLNFTLLSDLCMRSGWEGN